MLQPSRVRYRKMHKGRVHGKATAGNTVAFGDYGLQALEPTRLTARQIEAGRRAITHHLHRGGKYWVRVFPDKSVSKKAAETRMGSGKGAPDHWVAVVKIGKIIYELSGVDESTAKEALRLAANKLPIDARFVTKASSTLVLTESKSAVGAAAE